MISEPLVDGDHAVLFYETYGQVVSEVAASFAAALRGGGSTVAIATPEHRRDIDVELRALGVDLDDAIASGRYVAVDAEAVLAEIIVGDAPDGERFTAVVGGLLRDAAAHGQPVRAFGEMVALLWNRGQVVAALELERLWETIQQDLPFSLFCAYPVADVVDGTGAEMICAAHTHARGIAPVPAAFDEYRRFLPSRESARAARAFVSETLQGWALPDLVDDAHLVVSELVANAVVHGESDFVVALHREDDVVRITVSDRSATAPASRNGGPADLGGRGLRIVAALSRGWGCELDHTGKHVWAELPTTGGPR